MLTVEGVTKRYRRGPQANDGITFTARAGEVLGLLGHNGAGKTTLVNQVLGLLRPDAGTITVDGSDAVAQPDRARALCSVQAQAHVPLSGLTPRQAIELVGRLRGGGKEDVRRRTAALADRLAVGEWLDISSGPGDDGLSGGVRRLVAFAMAAVVPGRVVILDEPTNDVDPVRRRLLWGEVRRLADAGSAVVLITHNVDEAERAVDRLVVMDQGRVVAAGTPAELKEHVAGDLRLEVLWEHGIDPPPLPPFARNTVTSGRRIAATVPVAAATDAVQWAEAAHRARAAEEFAVGPTTLEDVYVLRE